MTIIDLQRFTRNHAQEAGAQRAAEQYAELLAITKQFHSALMFILSDAKLTVKDAREVALAILEGRDPQ